jgi:hypothetical protein
VVCLSVDSLTGEATYPVLPRDYAKPDWVLTPTGQGTTWPRGPQAESKTTFSPRELCLLLLTHLRPYRVAGEEMVHQTSRRGNQIIDDSHGVVSPAPRPTTLRIRCDASRLTCRTHCARHRDGYLLLVRRSHRYLVPVSVKKKKTVEAIFVRFHWSVCSPVSNRDEDHANDLLFVVHQPDRDNIA